MPRDLFPKPFSDFVQRLRVPCGFVLLAAFFWFSNPTPQSLLLWLPLSLLGLALRAWAAGHLAKNSTLAVSGPYAYMRNPLYAGTLLTAAGLALASRSAVLIVLFAAAFLLIYLPAVELEEQKLRELFPGYSAYADAVNRFWPFRKWAAAAARWSLALYRKNEEYKAAAGFLLAVGWLVYRAARL